jgi:membrane protein implicated in regulation of membrane protease activity
VLLILLALGTFLAGLNLPSVPICFLGFALVLAVPAISWVKQSALFLVLAVIAFIGLVIAYWSRRGPTHHTKAEERHASYSGSPE